MWGLEDGMLEPVYFWVFGNDVCVAAFTDNPLLCIVISIRSSWFLAVLYPLENSSSQITDLANSCFAPVSVINNNDVSVPENQILSCADSDMRNFNRKENSYPIISQYSQRMER